MNKLYLYALYNILLRRNIKFVKTVGINFVFVPKTLFFYNSYTREQTGEQFKFKP